MVLGNSILYLLAGALRATVGLNLGLKASGFGILRFWRRGLQSLRVSHLGPRRASTQGVTGQCLIE